MNRLPTHPLDHPGVLKILLGQTSSDLLAEHGDYHLAWISRPDATAPPEAMGRMVLHVVPLSKRQAMDSANVALGLATARPVKRDKQPVRNV